VTAPSSSSVSLTAVGLFSGIGGLELGLQRAGMHILAHVESDPFCQRVLAKQWPEADHHDDVRTFPTWWTSAPRPRVDVVCLGFPCQPFSPAGRRLGVADERWGWPWCVEPLRLLRPRYVLLENVADLLRHPGAFGELLGDLATLGFDAEWDVLPACAVGAPHRRRRLYLVAYPAGEGRLPGWPVGTGAGSPGRGQEDRAEPAGDGWWANEPDVARVAYGVPGRVDRARALGNAVVPQIPEGLGRMIAAHASAQEVAAA
jgi:DNA (cytosine-5)-methyltransferase 1